MLAWRRFALSKEPLTNTGGPVLRKCGGSMHRVLHRTLQGSDDQDDVMILAGMASAGRSAPAALQRKMWFLEKQGFCCLSCHKTPGRGWPNRPGRVISYDGSHRGLSFGALFVHPYPFVDQLIDLIAGELMPSEEDAAELTAATGIPGHEIQADLSDGPGTSWREVDPLHCYKPAEAALILNVKMDTLRNEIKPGTLESVAIGKNARRITRAALERRLRGGEHEANAEQRAIGLEATASDPPPQPGRLF